MAPGRSTDATGVVVSDQLPSGYTYISSSASSGSYDAASGLWTIGDVAGNSNELLTMLVSLNESGDYVNVAQVETADQDDSDSETGNDDPDEDDQDEATVTPLEDFCMDYIVEIATVCSPDHETYQVVIASSFAEAEAPNGFIIRNNLTGVEFTADLPIALGPFPTATPYDYTVTAFDLGCAASDNGSGPDCITTAIELIEFDGTAEESGNKLYWSTASENDFDRFILTKSHNGIDFEEISSIASTGGNTLENYGYFDEEVRSGYSFYRLTIVNLDGSTSLSNVVVLEREPRVSVNIYPIPTDDELTIEVETEEAQNGTVSIYNIAGAKMKDLNIELGDVGFGVFKIDLANIPQGVYMMVLVLDDGSTTVERIIKN